MRQVGTRRGIVGGSLALMILAAGAACGCTESSEKLDSPDASARITAVRNVARTNTEEAAQKLAPMVSHEDVMTAREVVRGLARIHSGTAARTLSQASKAEPRPEVRYEVAVALGYQANQEAVQALRNMVQAEEDAAVRGAAAAGLGRTGEYEDALILLAQVEREKDPAALAREVAALERLVGARFAYDPKAPPEERRQAIDRMKAAAPAMVKRLKTYAPPRRPRTEGQ